MAIGLSIAIIADLTYDKDKKLAGKELGKRRIFIGLER
jgi:hypothetical protein